MHLFYSTYMIFVISTFLVVVLSKRYDSRFDDADVDQILRNNRLLGSYIKCILDEGPCSPDGKALKDHVPDALVNSCGDCTEKQKKIVRKAVKFVMAKRPADWERIRKHFDPKSKYADSFDKFLNEN